MNPTSASNRSLPEDVSFLQSVLDYLRLFISGDNFKTTVILLYAVFALSAWKYIPSPPRFGEPETGKCVLTESFPSGTSEAQRAKPLDGSMTEQISPAQFFWNARKLWAAFLLMGVGPCCIVKFVFREKLQKYGLTPGVFKRTLVSFCNFVPIMLVIGWLSGNTKEFYAVYPFNPLAGVSMTALIVHSIMYLFLYYLAWEFMFRGFMQLGLSETIGVGPAILLQVLASTMLHYGHPASETFGCIAGGILWGYLVCRTKSIFSGWGQHAALGIALDWSLVLKAM